jgi:hypothetical protein
MTALPEIFHIPDDKFRERMGLGFKMDVSQVRIDSMNGHFQLFGDGFPAFGLGYQLQDVLLAPA